MDEEQKKLVEEFIKKHAPVYGPLEELLSDAVVAGDAISLKWHTVYLTELVSRSWRRIVAIMRDDLTAGNT